MIRLNVKDAGIEAISFHKVEEGLNQCGGFADASRADDDGHSVGQLCGADEIASIGRIFQL